MQTATAPTSTGSPGHDRYGRSVRGSAGMLGRFVFTIDASIGLPPVTCYAGSPGIYQSDIAFLRACKGHTRCPSDALATGQ